MYMEFRKRVLINIFAGQNRDADIENELVHNGGRRGGTN